MNRLKILIVLLFTLFLSGCDLTYELTLNEEKLEEYVYISQSKEKIEKLMKENVVGYDVVIYPDTFFKDYTDKIKKELYNNGFDYNLEYTSEIKEDNYNVIGQKKYKSLNEFVNTSSFSIISKRNVILSNDTISLKINNIDSKYFDDVDSFTIKIVSNYNCKENNAHEINKKRNEYEYVWTFYDESSVDVSILFDTTLTMKDKNEKINFFFIIFLILIVIGVSLFIYFYMRKKDKEINKI